ncbi:hypothetical protein Taro_008317 [Colocasia esculenta]|uniref:BED-type domain-containing protein n=1 Tax=Colocasia esculenta TaxID=4460 RepID=A0A843U1J4_COLES|nr:hypothetical protein [Colocasia esculenta]
MLGSRHNFKCNYCSFTEQGGGVSRLKKHLAGGRLAGYHDVQGCKMVPSEVKKLMIEHLKHVRAETTRKRANKEMQERIISGRERDEDIEDEVEMYAEYVPDLDVQERRARAQSRAETWEGDQRAAHRVSFQGAQHEVGSGSGSGSAVVLLQMLEVTVVVMVEVEVVTVVKFRPGGRGGGSPVDSHSYDTMISDFERMSTQESVGSYGGHNYHPEFTSTDYSSGYGPYSGYTATSGYLGPSPYMYPPTFSVPVPVQVFAPVKDVQMAQLNVVHPGYQVWDYYLSQFRQRYHTMMTWDEYPSFVSQTKGHHIIGELSSESDESESVPSQSQWNSYDPYQQGHWGY